MRKTAAVNIIFSMADMAPKWLGCRPLKTGTRARISLGFRKGLIVFLMAGAVFRVAAATPPGIPVQGSSPEAHVSIEDRGECLVLQNGVLAVQIRKADGKLVQLGYRGLSLLAIRPPGKGYWTDLGNVPGQAVTDKVSLPATLRIVQDPANNGGRMGEIEFSFPYRGKEGVLPFDIVVRYGLKQGDSALYCLTSLEHRPGYPPFELELAEMSLKLDPAIFDHLTVDRDRNRQMITPQDWLSGRQMNLKEAREMTTGIHKGEVEHKYDYAAMLSETPAYGWSSSEKGIGIWLVNPSLEYVSGAPTQVELTGHIDGKPTLPADPTLLFFWQGCHYGAEPLSIRVDEAWRKVSGPFLIYCNAGPGPDALWKDALARAQKEPQEWPYAWEKAPGYASAEERGAVTGRLTVADPQQPGANARDAWIGLAQPPYEGIDQQRKPLSITWQTDGKHYQHWTRADASGGFTVRNARPGHYTLYAFNKGILGEFQKADVAVEAGKTTDLGELRWTPVRHGRQVWEIGVPDRSAAEFRHGDHYWQWGLYRLYPQEFPFDVAFTVGKSDWARDWNYAQPARQFPDGAWHGPTWRIFFDLPQVPSGKATLCIAICGAKGIPADGHSGARVDVSVNGASIGSTGDIPSSGVMHRDGIRGTQFEADLPFDASLMVAGRNEIDLTLDAHRWYDGVLYDYLRLEIADAEASRPGDSK